MGRQYQEMGIIANAQMTEPDRPLRLTNVKPGSGQRARCSDWRYPRDCSNQCGLLPTASRTSWHKVVHSQAGGNVKSRDLRYVVLVPLQGKAVWVYKLPTLSQERIQPSTKSQRHMGACSRGNAADPVPAKDARATHLTKFLTCDSLP